jgi:Fe-S-cluster containining protein
MMDKWWSGGVRFVCIECGRCCRGEPGAIFFTPEEGARIREKLKVEESEFRRRYVTNKWGSPSLVERQNGDCVMYDAETAKCVIYPLRPAQCSLFPFWPSVMESREEWEEQTKHCPGMNEGRFYAADEIQRFLDQCPFQDL